MTITCIKKDFTFKGTKLNIESPITIGKSYEVIKKELQGPQGCSYENGDKEWYLYTIVGDDRRVYPYHEIFFYERYIDEIRNEKIEKILT